MEQNGLGHWERILDVLSYFTVLCNSVFLYWFRKKIIVQVRDLLMEVEFLLPFSVSWWRINQEGLLGPRNAFEGETVLEQRLMDKDMLDFLILIIFIEHLIVFIKFIMSTIISDVPVWVQKKLVKVQLEMEKLSI